jgi:hypothetical protein
MLICLLKKCCGKALTCYILCWLIAIAVAVVRINTQIEQNVFSFAQPNVVDIF